jgi:hypothetical protein
MRLGDERQRLAFTGVLLGLIVLYVAQWRAWQPLPPYPLPTMAGLPVSSVRPVEQDDLRQRAWSRIQLRLEDADRACQSAAHDSINRVAAFFASKQAAARSFAKTALSWESKWYFIKDRLPFTDGSEHQKYLHKQFSLHVLKPGELERCVEGTFVSFLSQVQGIENQLLVQVRADLSEGEWAMIISPTLREPVEWRAAFERHLEAVSQCIGEDLRLRAGQECLALVGGEVAAQLALRIGAATAQRLGASAGVFGTAISSSWATIGVGLAAAIAVDAFVDSALSAAGYDPEAVVSEKIAAGLANLEQFVMFGDSEAHHILARMYQQAAQSRQTFEKQQHLSEIQKIKQSGKLGLRFELINLHQQRAAWRREALRRLVWGESPP